jgi:hypothetical protein
MRRSQRRMPWIASLGPRLTPRSGDGAARGSCGQERWGRMAFEAGPMTPRQILEHAPPLLPTRRHRREHPLHEPAPHLAVGAAADPPPDHRVPQRPFGRVVRGLDTLDAGGNERVSGTHPQRVCGAHLGLQIGRSGQERLFGFTRTFDSSSSSSTRGIGSSRHSSRKSPRDGSGGPGAPRSYARPGRSDPTR